MSPIRTIRRAAALLASSAALVVPATADPTVAEPMPAARDVQVDPDFDPGHLSPLARTWYDRVVESIEASRETIETRAASDDLYLLGRFVGDYQAALVAALRATGDRRFLDRVYEVAEIARASLRDAWDDGTTDGHLNWRMRTADAPPYHGNDRHQMDEAMVHGNVALWAAVLDANRDVDARFAEAADFWRDYLENHFLAKWRVRAGGDRVASWDGPRGFYKRFVHPRINQLRAAHYLWRLTGDGFYRERERSVSADVLGAIVENPTHPGAVRWKHQVSGKDEGWQKLNYAQYALRVMIELYEEQVDGFDEWLMTRLATTVRDVVFAEADEHRMTARISGEGSTGLRVFALSAYAAWDPTGRILRIADATYKPGSYGLSTAAYALWALCP